MASKKDGYQVSSIMKKLNSFHEQLHLHNSRIQLLLHEQSFDHSYKSHTFG